MNYKYILILLIACKFHSGIAQESRLLRFPTIHSDKLVFTYAGNLYVCPTTGGVARRLTDHAGVEIFARFSPDGKSIAFSGQYDGNTELYHMPSEGGVPIRITYTATLNRDDVSDRMGPNNICMGWKDKETLIMRSRGKEFNDWKGQLYLVKKDGSMPEQIPVPHGGFCSFSPDGKRMAFNRVFREFRTWKRYRGGQADEIWIYDFNTQQTIKITDNPAQDIIPMWFENRVYFLSDRDSRMNLFMYDFSTKKTIKLTEFKDYDVKFPSLGDKHIVFENGGYIYKLDLNSHKYEKVNIQIKEDFASGRSKWIQVKDYISSYDISPDGNRVCLSARGEVFTVPAKNGPIRNISGTSGVHERNVSWSPDGSNLAFIADYTGEDEVYIQKSNGSEKPVPLTEKSKCYKYNPVWSPDGTKLIYSDRNQKVFLIDVNSRKETLIFSSDVFEIRDYKWSPDSKYICYTNPVRKGNSVINIYSIEDKKNITVTETWFDSYQPVFSPDGKYLYFVSQRTFNPSYNNLEWNHAYFDLAKIYLITLKKDGANPFAPKSDEAAIRDLSSSSSKEKENSGSKNDQGIKSPVKSDSIKTKNMGIDFEGIQDRIVELPISPGNYWNLTSSDDKIYYFRSSLKEGPKMCFYDLKSQKETELGEKINNFIVSADLKKMLIQSGGKYFTIDIPSSKVNLENALNLDDLKVYVNRSEEWRQIYFECWRQMRDFFYDPGMHGVDWENVKSKYSQLLPFVNHRIDLTYLIGEMIGELNCGHAYVGGGDYPKAERVQLGLLGADFVKDASGYFKIKNIYRSQNWDKSVRCPLTELGVNAQEGDFILAVDGISTRDIPNIYTMMVGKANQQIKIRLGKTTNESDSRDVTVIPIGDESSLIYYDWVQNNIDKVNKATNGRVGYIHIPNMGSDGLNEFVKYFYAQLAKEALIVDDRGNGGGNVSPQIIERLRREPIQITKTRNGAPVYEPADQVVGPKVALIDEYSASDGDIFAYRFKKSGLGPVIGKRSWGGVVGIRGSLPIIDGGILNRPEFARYDVDGKDWQIEGHGVDPDIWVDNDPASEYKGVDEQLNKAIEHLLEILKNKQFKEPAPPAYPRR